MDIKSFLTVWKKINLIDLREEYVGVFFPKNFYVY